MANRGDKNGDKILSPVLSPSVSTATTLATNFLFGLLQTSTTDGYKTGQLFCIGSSTDFY